MCRMVVVEPRDVAMMAMVAMVAMGAVGAEASIMHSTLNAWCSTLECSRLDTGMLDTWHWNTWSLTLECSRLDTGMLNARRWNAWHSTLEHVTWHMKEFKLFLIKIYLKGRVWLFLSGIHRAEKSLRTVEHFLWFIFFMLFQPEFFIQSFSQQ